MPQPADLTASLVACDKVLVIRQDGRTKYSLTKQLARKWREAVDEPTRQLIDQHLPQMAEAVFHQA